MLGGEVWRSDELEMVMRAPQPACHGCWRRGACATGGLGCGHVEVGGGDVGSEYSIVASPK